MDWASLFNTLNPGFFQRENIRALPERHTFAELVMDLRTEGPGGPVSVPDGITFGVYTGGLAELRETVRRVDPDWVQYFNEGDRVFCAFAEGKPVAFCNLDEMGQADGLRIGGPGCVGTLPEHRCQGIGLEMVRRATELLRREGFDLSWIHYTHLEHWYSRLGYRTVLHWNSRGILPE